MNNVGKYQILEELGVGSMGTVYRAKDTVLDREVALKTIRAGPSVEPEIKERFHREARAGARLHHPNIVTIHDFGEIEDTAYISMELLIGQDLRKLIEIKKPFAAARKMDLIAQVSDALAHAHCSGIVHRDIKPSNIFIVEETVAKVLDFGIARLPLSQLTMLGRVLGTPNYMAPEQIKGNPCDGRSDLFSLAIVFFEFLTGVHPFQSAYIPRSIVGQPPTKLRSIDASFPVSLEQLLDKALQSSPEGRFQDADEFAAALRALRSEVAAALHESGDWRPSEVPTLAGEATPAAPNAPELELSAEQRASEFFRLMQECDTALEAGMLDKARSALDEMKRLAATDTRFGIAVLDYERQVLALEERMGVRSQPQPSVGASSSPSFSVVTSGSGDTSGPATSDPRVPISADEPTAPVTGWSTEQLDVTRRLSMSDFKAVSAAQQPGGLLTDSPVKKPPQAPIPSPASAEANSVAAKTSIEPPAVAPAETRPKNGATAAVPRPSAPAHSGKSPASSKTPLTRNKTAMIIGFAVVLIVAAVSVRIFSKPRYQAVMPIGTAVVVIDGARIFAGPDTAEEQLATAAKGSKLNVIHRPRTSNPRWIAVQQGGQKPGPPGYIQAAALGQWSTLDLLQLFDPGAQADVPQRNAYLQLLRASLSRLEKLDQSRAWAEIASQNVAIASQEKNSGVAADKWQKNVSDAREALAKISADPAFKEDSKAIGEQIADLTEAPPPPVAPAPVTEPVRQVQHTDTTHEYQEADEAYEEGQYDRAIQLLKRILSVESANTRARNLLQKVQKAAAEEAAESNRSR